MAVQERAGFLKFNDESGNVNLLFPITTVDNIDGMDEIQEDIANSVKIVPQILTEAQKAQARENIGITPDMFEGGNSGSSDVSWNDITDKPFEIIGGTIFEWIGTIEPNVPAFVADTTETTLNVGDTYSAIWDGIEYSTKCVDTEGVRVIGNTGVVLGTGDNGIPFVVVRDMSGVMGLGIGWIVMPAHGEPATDHTLTVSAEQIKHLDNKYLSILDYTPPVVNEQLPVTTFENFYYSSAYGCCVQDGNEDYSLTVGKEYDVTWDGVAYKCVAQDISAAMPNGIALGNAAALASVFAGNNEPFIIGVVVGSGGVLYASLTDTQPGNSHTIGISQTAAEEVYRIKSEYIPQEGRVLVLGRRTFDNFVYIESASARVSTGSIDPDCVFKVGATYVVVWDGVEYEVVAQDGDDAQHGTVILGNGSSFELSGNNEPFAIVIDDNAMTIFAFASNSTTHTIIIYQDLNKRKVPLVTQEDEGKVLTVVNGVPKWEENSGGPGSKVDLFPEEERGFSEYPTLGCYISSIHYSVEPGYDIFELAIGENCIVVWDGIEYPVVAQDGNSIEAGVRFIGNGSSYGLSGNNEPFVIAYTDAYMSFFALDALETHTVRIYKEVKNPSSIPDVTVADNGKFLQVVDGTWAAVAIGIAEEASF